MNNNSSNDKIDTEDIVHEENDPENSMEEKIKDEEISILNSSEEEIDEKVSEPNITEENDTEVNSEEIIDASDIIQVEQKGAPEEIPEEELRDIYRNLIEGALFAAGRGLTIEELSTKLDIKKKEIEEFLNELLDLYNNRSSSLTIVNIGETYQMQIKPEYSEKISQFAQGGAIAEKYLRTLTIIALKQPILKSTVIKMRGSGAYDHIKYLIENEYIISEKKGRSAELITTDKYAEMFGLPRDKHEMKKAMIEQLGIDQK